MLNMEVLYYELWGSVFKHNEEANKDGKGYGALVNAAVAIALTEVIKALEKAER